MDAIILAAGYAKRLYPYTRNYPKSLLNVSGKPVLNYVIEKLLTSMEIKRIFIIVNAIFNPYFQKWLMEFRTVYSQQQKARQYTENPLKKIRLEIINDHTMTNETRLGSIGDLQFAINKKKLKNDLLVICSDKIFNFDLNIFLDYYKQKKSVINASLNTGDAEKIINKHGCLVLDKANKILSFVEKPAVPISSIKSLAFYIYPQTVLPLIKEYLQAGHNPDAPGYFSEWLHQKVPMYAWFINGECLDIGNQESYLEANRLFYDSAQLEYFFQKKVNLSDLTQKAKNSSFKENKLLLILPQNPRKKILRQLRSILKNYINREKNVTLCYIMIKQSFFTSFTHWLSLYPMPLPIELLTINGQVEPGSVKQLHQIQGLGISAYLIIDNKRNNYNAHKCISFLKI